MFRRFKREFSYHDDELGGRRRIPRGWAGELDAAVAKRADEEGATVKTEAPKKVSKAEAAAIKAVAAAEAALEKATDLEKASAEQALSDAQEKLAELQDDD